MVNDEIYPALSEDWNCHFRISLSPETISIFQDELERVVALGYVGGDDQLLGSVTLECDSNITAPTLDIGTDCIAWGADIMVDALL